MSGFTLEPRDGFTFTAEIVPDGEWREPWTEEDGHGPVSGWRRQNYMGRYGKAPGELLLYEDRGNAMFYDFAAACKQALAEGWDAAPHNTGAETPRQQAAKAARADFERLRDFCNGDRCYVGVVVTASRGGVELGSTSLWGIESDAGDYLEQVAQELADEALEEAQARLAALCDCKVA